MSIDENARRTASEGDEVTEDSSGVQRKSDAHETSVWMAEQLTGSADAAEEEAAWEALHARLLAEGHVPDATTTSRKSEP